ncbi:AfsR/SARP family transcriptional regulator [Nonomuraea lactucae]|uniref:AfsR/SARP family transcriptional regulator n=1 Tax=Nonomuraea lactucae TaxID=2249762 RepID=UPI001F062F66|nr:BTAD domain-containing putative transcriptional regulator [Nonomuraea lactucae]
MALLVIERGNVVATEDIPCGPRLTAAQRRLMGALHAAGRRQEALEVFQRARASLQDDLGVDPGPRLSQIQRAVLAGDRLIA